MTLQTQQLQFSDLQRDTLAALADTFCAAVPAPDGADPDGFFARTASDLGVPAAAEQYLLAMVPEAQLTGLMQLIDTMASLGLKNQPLVTREVIAKTVAGIAPEARAGVDAIRQLVLLLAYGNPDETGVNPFWKTWGYPGPVSAPPDVPKTLSTITPDGDTELTADVVVVGSGSGGGVMAAELAKAGHDVLVLEMGGYFNEADFNQYELWAYENLYLRGGYFPTADLNVSMISGSNVGGGSTVNWSNSVKPRADVRARWAREFGMEGLDTDEFDGHVQAVLDRISANTDCSDRNGPHQRMEAGAASFGWHVRTSALNTHKDRYDPVLAGYTGFGDQSGAKQGSMKTWLQDACDAGARVLPRTKARRILVDNGRAAGVEASFADPATGATATVTVHAKAVVAACGSLETPALLLRSGIGGPSVGSGLRLHPSTVVGGIYPEQQDMWWGPPQASILDEFADKDADETGTGSTDSSGIGYGHIIEGIQHGLALLSASMRWQSAAQHKELLAKIGRASFFVGITQDRGSGAVVIDESGEAVHLYPISDELDRRHIYETLEAMVRLHEAAGAEEIHVPSPDLEPWRRGEDLDAFIATMQAAPLGFGGIAVFSAHQMGSAHIGTDPASSVTRPTGELHDTPGVWIGDTSEFPSCSGENPMVSCMSLARRTAGYLDAVLGGRTAPSEPHLLAAADPGAVSMPAQPDQVGGVDLGGTAGGTLAGVAAGTVGTGAEGATAPGGGLPTEVRS
ncbi:MAG TPA: GMC family oxidoreductase [Frankiaceae bacterium]|nr:GMC family oxidoreductase [Frankiaceae bacterium]